MLSPAAPTRVFLLFLFPLDEASCFYFLFLLLTLYLCIVSYIFSLWHFFRLFQSIYAKSKFYFLQALWFLFLFRLLYSVADFRTSSPISASQPSFENGQNSFITLNQASQYLPHVRLFYRRRPNIPLHFLSSFRAAATSCSSAYLGWHRANTIVLPNGLSWAWWLSFRKFSTYYQGYSRKSTRAPSGEVRGKRREKGSFRVCSVSCGTVVSTSRQNEVNHCVFDVVLLFWYLTWAVRHILIFEKKKSCFLHLL